MRKISVLAIKAVCGGVLFDPTQDSLPRISDEQAAEMRANRLLSAVETAY